MLGYPILKKVRRNLFLVSGQLKVVEFLLEKRADVNVKDADEKNCLHRAAESQNEAICRMLVEGQEALKLDRDVHGKRPSDYAKSAHLANYLKSN